MYLIRNISYIVSIIAMGGLGMFVFLSNTQHRINKIFLLLCVSTILWILTLFVADSTQAVPLALLASKLSFVTSLPILLAVALFARNFPKEASRKVFYTALACFGLPIVLIAALSSGDLAVKEVAIRSYGADVVTGPLYTVLGVYGLIIIVYTLYHLIRSYRKESGRAKTQIQYVFIGLSLSLFFTILTNVVLVLMGISSLGFLGPATLLFFVGFTASAIVRHSLFNIRAVVARSVTYVFSVFSIGALYGLLAFGTLGEFLTKQIFTSELGQRAIFSFLAVVLAFTFPTIQRFFERITDRVFYRDKYDPQVLVSDIGRVLASEIRLDPLSKRVTRILEDHMRVTDANIIVLGYDDGADPAEEHTNTEIYYQTHSDKDHQKYDIKDIRTIRLPVVITDELASSDEKSMLEKHGIRASLTLKTKEAFVGYLLLGDKRSGDIYSDQDIQTLRIIANELAVAIQNARSYQEIQQFNETLKDKIKIATKEVTHANKELKALDKAKDEFISMASHQLRTPLTAVRGYTSMVMDGDFGKISGEQKDTLRQSFDAATRMTRLVDDLLNVSRIQSGKFRLERADVDLNKVLPEELSLIETTASAKSVKVTFHPPKVAVPLLKIDEGKTRQCLMNLMDNSIYYSSTTPGGGKVDVYLEADKTDVIFRVVDNGIGVPKDQQAKLFKKFYRAPNAQKTRPDGTGLGLFLVGKVVRDQAGKIIFESTEGKGSTFGFSLPIKAAGEGLAPEKEAGAPVATKA